MQPESKNRVEPIFHAACTHAAGAERQAYLDGACGDEAELRERVEVLLAAHDQASCFLEGPAVTSSREGLGSMIGVYKLLQEIGEGGMGVVYMAEQERPVRRKVALKVIKLGMDTKQVIARFEAERQALAMMDHENIARVLDAGATETGRPYFVMELVRGVPINEYCDTNKLTTGERLGLFVDVCRGVQHAHQKGIIHRDLKPTNVLVTSHDGTPVPKIIDFGVAKATNQRLTEHTLFTEFHQIIGTPEYMSPEQAKMSGIDVDTRSDIYSLGVLLYQLLTGTTPVDATELRAAAYDEMTRIIREDEPPSPSTRISKLGADGEKIAKHRSSDAGALSRHLRGDLDWIVMKALEKDRTRRYETASAFAQDVARHLEQRPVEAGPPGTAYRLRKFAQRNRKAVSAAVVLLVVIGLGLAGTISGFLRASAEADRSQKISASLQEVLAITNTVGSQEDNDFERVLETVRETFGEDHATYAAILDTLSLRLRDTGGFETAAELSSESLEVWKKIYGEQHPNVGLTLGRLGSILRAQGRVEQAEIALRGALTIFPDSSDAPGLRGFPTRVELADLLANRGEYAEADHLLGEALTILRASQRPVHYQIIETLEKRFVIQANLPTVDGIETISALYDEVRKFFGDDNPILAISAMGYGKHLVRYEQSEAAIPYLREAIKRFRADPNPPGVYVVAACEALFQILRSRTDAESVSESNDLFRDILKFGREFLGTDELAGSLRLFATRMIDSGRFSEALDAITDGHQALVDAGKSINERESLRDGLTYVAFRVAFESGLETELYARARDAIDRALLEEPEHPAMLVVLGVVLYRLGEFELAAEKLNLPEPLSSARGGLARAISPADLAFGAMARARLDQRAVSPAEFEFVREAFGPNQGGAQGRMILQELESLLEQPPSSIEDR